MSDIKNRLKHNEITLTKGLGELDLEIYNKKGHLLIVVPQLRIELTTSEFQV